VGRRVKADSGVVNEDVDAAEALQRSCDYGFACCLLREIARHHGGVGTGDRRKLFFGASGDDEPCSTSLQGLDERSSNAFRRASHDRDFAV
jgi:hypothetical protein